MGWRHSGNVFHNGHVAVAESSVMMGDLLTGCFTQRTNLLTGVGRREESTVSLVLGLQKSRGKLRSLLLLWTDCLGGLVAL